MSRAACAIAIASLFLASTARAEREADELGFGVVPSFHIGKVWGSLSDPTGAAPTHTGTVLEGAVTGLVVLPGDHYGFGLTGSYSTASLFRSDAAGEIDYSGWSVSPTAMIAAGPIFFQAYAGPMFVSVGSEAAMVDATLFRFGAGLTFAFLRNGDGGGIALTFDVSRASSSNVALPTHKAELGLTTATVGIAVAF